MVTFFLACFILDQRRIESSRNGCCFCFVHQNFAPNDCSQKSLLELAFTNYAEILVKVPFKMAILVVTCTFLGIGLYGMSKLEAEFNMKLFLPDGTYLREYFDVSEDKFPGGGISGKIYVANVSNVHQYMEELKNMVDE